jgi:predicted acyltransferase
MMELDRQQTEQLLSPTSGRADQPTRLASLDAYRGFIMLLLISGAFGIHSVTKKFPDSGFWTFLGYQFEHVPWSGCGAFWDLIQPAFLFMVGVAIPYSYASRKASRLACNAVPSAWASPVCRARPPSPRRQE